MFSIEKHGIASNLSLAELEEQFGFRYVPKIQFANPSIFLKCVKKTEKLQQKGALDFEQKWLGAYFRNELQKTPLIETISSFTTISWIGEDIGWGLIAQRDISRMQYIGEYTGFFRKRIRLDVKNSYCFGYSISPEEETPYVIDARDQGGLVRLINHSSKPNLASALATVDHFSHVIFFANRNISKGEQLSYDYGEDYWKLRSRPKEF